MSKLTVDNIIKHTLNSCPNHDDKSQGYYDPDSFLDVSCICSKCGKKVDYSFGFGNWSSKIGE